MADIDNKEQSELDQDLDDAEEVEEEETGEETKIKAHQLTVQMMQNPQILAALQERLDGLVETPTGYVESLPRVVKRRVNALKNLQARCAQIEAKFYEEVHDLERKYAVLYQPLFDKRFEIINAIYEPTEEECEWKPDEEDEISEELKEKAKIEDEKKDEEKEDPKGIPEVFQLTLRATYSTVTGIITLLQPLNLDNPENPKTYSLEIEAIDNANNTSTYVFSVFVEDVDDPIVCDPSFSTGAGVSMSVPENVPASAFTYMILARDPDPGQEVEIPREKKVFLLWIECMYSTPNETTSFHEF
ncbi:hypothetical protein E5288_WYG004271 [Bos mutus]|uniref:Cadherin domain-containing protein n=1 Tax=Bos mutus TaxID=72004 RepID=A0A6B0R5P9_9CETA|nr:hypothetical protein [Bos mutus]